MIHLSAHGEKLEMGDWSELSPRQQDILYLAVNDHILNSMTISSLQLTERYDLGLSSATIRSLLSELEQKEYLYSPHRSSGRFPTARGYRFYLDHLQDNHYLSEEDRMLVQSEYLKRDFQLIDVMETSSRIMSMLTDYAGVVMGPRPEMAVVKHIELIDLGEDEVLIVVVTRSGSVYNRSIYLEERVPGEFLHRISRFLNSLVKGKHLADAKAIIIEQMHNPREFSEHIPLIVNSLVANFDLVGGEEEYFTSGVDKLYSHLGETGERIKELGSLFDKEGSLKRIFRQASLYDDLVCTVENDRDVKVPGVSVMATSYSMGGRQIGSIGVVGPNYMNYSKVISVVQYMSYLISNMVTRLSN